MSDVIFTQKYNINVGDDHKIITAVSTDIYKFHRVDGFRSRNASMGDTLSPPTSATRKYLLHLDMFSI